jgi:hypothetical protein
MVKAAIRAALDVWRRDKNTLPLEAETVAKIWECENMTMTSNNRH